MNDYKELIDSLREEATYTCFDHCAKRCEEVADAIEQLVRERDAAVESIKQCWLCASCRKRIRGNEWASCKHFKEETLLVNNDKSYTCKNWEWRGVTE